MLYYLCTYSVSFIGSKAISLHGFNNIDQQTEFEYKLKYGNMYRPGLKQNGSRWCGCPRWTVLLEFFGGFVPRIVGIIGEPRPAGDICEAGLGPVDLLFQIFLLLFNLFSFQLFLRFGCRVVKLAVGPETHHLLQVYERILRHVISLSEIKFIITH